MTAAPPRLAIVVPCYNEEGSLPGTAARLATVVCGLMAAEAISSESFILFVDDGSRDATWRGVSVLHAEEPGLYQGLKLSRNFGHQNALMAGLRHVSGRCDCAVSIDADLQQDETRIPEFVARYRAGFEIVLGVRADRTTDTLFKKTTALLFYKLTHWLYSKAVQHHADYRLLGSRALEALARFEEYHLFLRFLVLELGFPVSFVEYHHGFRQHGETKYPLPRMLAFAWNGITSFSVMPLRLIMFLGIAMFLFSVGQVVFIVFYAFLGHPVPGWASTVVPIYMLSGVQLFSIGIIGEYIGKVYQEVKRRPRYIVETVLHAEEPKRD